ncbi:hypothetical protein SAMN02745163_03653 [Clostridium cavendishii DSM 21758]|uniref:Uncharacterized protein n=1 Tax=Clostridium cavendishii DSM 21758 TaxID=1121302 RepID=A0A1M6RRF7_9CLOT|nr:hypothetical protein [Clostridium cavendishii]SHK35062.1 hypothetical protein SAMN02745163_03653 [Clostridium cavendishii DSM 21758]
MKKILLTSILTGTLLVSALTFNSTTVKANEIQKDGIQATYATSSNSLTPIRELAENAGLKVVYFSGIVQTVDSNYGTKSMRITDILRKYPKSLFRDGVLYMTKADFEDAFLYYN